MKNKNIIFSSNAYNQLQQVTSNKHSVPFGIKLEFSSPSVPKEESLCKFVQDAGFSSVFMQKVIEAHMDPDSLSVLSSGMWASSTGGMWLTPEEVAARTAAGMTVSGAGFLKYTEEAKALIKAQQDQIALINKAAFEAGVSLGDKEKQSPPIGSGWSEATDFDEVAKSEDTTGYISDTLKLDYTTATEKLAKIEEDPAMKMEMRLDRDWIPTEFYSQKYLLNNEGEPTLVVKPALQTVRSQAFDIMEFFQRMVVAENSSDVVDSIIKDRNIFIHSGNEVNIFAKSWTKDFATISPSAKLGAFILAGQFRKLLDEKARSWSEILAGKHSPTEILFFEIEKTSILPNGVVEVIQRFYIPNFVGRDTIELLDSQVKFDGLYQYSIFAWTAIYGNKYKYVDNPWSNASPPEHNHLTSATDFNSPGNAQGVGKFRYTVHNIPKLWLERLPYYAFYSVRVRDCPPVAPNGDIVPYRAVSDKLLLNFAPAIDDYLAPPIALRSGDHSKIARYYDSQYAQRTSTAMNTSLYEAGTASIPVRFKTDDPPKFYEVYRIHFPPTQWSDFGGARIGILNVDELETSMVDNVIPNRDYYYTFRSVDIHNNISNPSHVLRVKLLDDQGVFPVIEIYDFEKLTKPDSGFKKSVRRFLQVTPVFEQLVYKDNRQANQQLSVADQSSVVLGTAKESIYGKTLKIRLTSKKSGKMFDINVKFTHKHIKPQQ
ncbi:hypothetical protein CL622_08450 [archaeon]|nr:hypothetical protein [archaeon]